MKKGLYQANCDMPIKYSFQHGGGTGSRTIKKGEFLNVVGVLSDIDSHSVEVKETLYRIELNYFNSNFTYVGGDLKDVINALVPGGQKISFNI